MLESEVSPDENVQLIGREAELACVDALLDERTAGASLLCVVGEAGIGKSSLLRAAERKARTRGWRVAWGRSWEAAQDEALWPWQEVAAQLEWVPPTPQREESRAAYLRRWIDSLEEAHGDERCLLLLDDFQWADESSVLLADWLCRQTSFRACKVIVAWRGPEVVSNPPRWQRLEALRRLGTTVELTGLKGKDVEAYLKTAGLRLSAEEVPPLQALTGGNPFFLQEIVVAKASGRHTTLTEGVRAYVAARVAPESAEHRRLLSAASILGRIFEPALLCGLLDVSVQELTARLEHSQRAGFLALHSTQRWAFRHDLLREAIYDGLEVPERQRRHARAAQVLMKRGSSEGAQTFEHLWRSEPEVSALLYPARDAASYHFSHLAYESCLSVVERFDALAEGASWDALELTQIAELALTAACSGMYGLECARGKRMCCRVMTWGERAEAPQLVAQAAILYGHGGAFSTVDHDHVALLRAVLERPEFTAKRPVCDVVLGAWALKLRARLAAALQPAEEPKRVLAMAMQCVAAARKTQDETLLGEVLELSRGALRPLDALDARLAHDRETLNWAERQPGSLSVVEASLRLAGDELEAGHRGVAEQLLDRAEHWARKLRLPGALARLFRIRASLATLDGRVPEARELLGAAQRLELPIEEPDGFKSRELHRLWLLRWWGELTALRAELSLGQPPSRVVVASFQLWSGKLAAAQASYEIFRRSAYPQHYPDLVLRPELVSALGTKAEAEATYTQLLGLAAQHMVFAGAFCVSDGSYQRHLGLLAARAGRSQQALEHLRAAVVANEAVACGPVLALTRRQLATLEQGADPTTAHCGALSGAVAGAGISPPGPTEVRGLEMQLSGSMWRIRYGSLEVLLEDGDGLRYLAWLVERPQQEIHVLELMELRRSAMRPNLDDGDLDLVRANASERETSADARAFSAYRREAERLRDAENHARELGATSEAECLRQEQLQLAEFVTREQNRSRRSCRGPAEKARVNVTQRIRKAISKLGALDAHLGHHLEVCVRTGRLCSYRPPPDPS